MDFLVRRWPRLSFIGVTVLLMGIVFIGVAAFELSEAFDQRRVEDERLEMVQGRLTELRGAQGGRARVSGQATREKSDKSANADRQSRRLAEAQQVVRSLDAPWNSLFEALEVAQDDSVALLSLAPEMTSGHLALSGEARDYAALTAYLERLDKGGFVRQVQLLSHEIKGDDHYVVFTAGASLGQ